MSKFLIVKYPLRAIHLSGKAAHVTTCFIWLYSSIFPTAAVLRDKAGVYFSYLYYSCSYSCTINKSWTPLGHTLYNISVGLSVFLSTAVTFVSSILLLILAKKVSKRAFGRMQWQGILMVLATVAFHILISIPVVVAFLTSLIVGHDKHSVNKMFRYAVFIAAIAPIGNFYIYTLTLSSFREFLITTLRKMTAACWRQGREEERYNELGEQGD
jgi:hypothetical protein